MRVKHALCANCSKIQLGEEGQCSDQHHSIIGSTGSWVLPTYLSLDLITWAGMAWRPLLQLEGRRGIASWIVHFKAVALCLFAPILECRGG